jgi:glycosyltransferase involved in cell wall biosynthesis
MPEIVVIIPVLNEADAIGHVIGDIPEELVDEIIVVNNGSTDQTARIAAEAGAVVLSEPRRGYGWACLRGIEYIEALQPDIVVFLDGDYSDHPEEMSELIAPIVSEDYDFVVGSRIRGEAEPGALLPQARIGNQVACTLMRWLWGGAFTDLGPFRAIRYESLLALDMEDKTYGWTIEMQIKALQQNLRYTEVPVSYRKRIGTSKVTGTVSDHLKASAKILWTIGKYAVRSTSP